MKTSYSVNQLSVRRFLLESQYLLSHKNIKVSGSTGAETALQMVRKLECVQIDPVSVVERNQHLVLNNRIPGYRPEHLDHLLSKGKVFEYKANEACIIPVEDYPIFKPVRERIRKHVLKPLKQLDKVAQSVLKRLEADGPLPSRAFKSENRVHGYWDNKVPKTKETSLALNLLLDGGFIRVVRRERTERFFDLTERSIPKEYLEEADKIEAPVARQALIDKYIRAYRLVDPRDPRFGWQKMTAAERKAEIDERVKNGKMVPLEIEHVNRPYFILAEDLEELERIAGTMIHKDYGKTEYPIRFLSPLDNLLWRRERVADLFGFDYKWEIYTPHEKRLYGPYAMPILWGDRLIGRIDPRLNRKNSQLIIQLLQLEQGIQFTQQLRNHLRNALESFAGFHQVEKIVVERTEPAEVIV